ncbi:MAG: 2-methylisocitrate lyase [Robiginitomaculum sp.]|nr:MAG: 2-methylisocitrate lyase [Robiginitomaculum sp.]
MMVTQKEKGRVFRALHETDEAFIIPNPWDIGTAKLLQSVGFKALATTGAGYAFSIGQQDGTLGRNEMLTYVRDIASATDLPVSADLESGFGDEPDFVAQTIELGWRAGLVGASIEDIIVDNKGRSSKLHELDFAVERIKAAVAAARKAPCMFTLTARCENYLIGNPDLKDTIKRLQAYQNAGADVLYAPGVTQQSEIEAIVKSLDKPVNVVVGLKGIPMSRDELSSLGVKRISLGSTLSRTALGAFLKATDEILNQGTFGFSEQAVEYSKINSMF